MLAQNEWQLSVVECSYPNYSANLLRKFDFIKVYVSFVVKWTLHILSFLGYSWYRSLLTTLFFWKNIWLWNDLTINTIWLIKPKSTMKRDFHLKNCRNKKDFFWSPHYSILFYVVLCALAVLKANSWETLCDKPLCFWALFGLFN